VASWYLVMSCFVTLSALLLAQPWSAVAGQGKSLPFNSITLKDSYGNTVALARTSEQVVIGITVVNNFEHELDVTAVIEARDAEGTTQYLAFQSNRLDVGNRVDIGTVWIPSKAGDYKLRTFLITGLTNPQVLSEAVETTAKVEASLSTETVWVALNSSQCADPWDDLQRQYNLDTTLQDFFKERDVYFFKSREVPIYPEGEMASCSACICSSAKTLYLEVSKSDIGKMKEYGFVEQPGLKILNPPSQTAATKIMRPLWLPSADLQGQLDAYKPVLQDYDWPRLRMEHGSNSIPADDLAAFVSLNGHKLLSVTTLEKVKAHTAWAKSQGFAGVEYNIERGFDAGDTKEQIREAASVVHAAGLKFVSTPTKAILADNWETIADVADMVHIQGQTLQDNPSEFDAFVEDWVQKMKARNPNIIVTVQTGTGHPTAPGMTMLETFQYVTDLVIVDPDAAVDGVSVWFGAREEGLMESYFKWYHEKYRTGDPTNM
jgi:hypothetical protein